MVNIWNTEELFASLLLDFKRLTDSASTLVTPNTEDVEPIRVAVVGFLLFSRTDRWTHEYYVLVRERLDDELSDQQLREWHDEHAEAIQRYSCLAIGALLGKLDTGQIDDAGFLLGDAHLAGFIAMNEEAIGTRYRA